MPGRKKPREGSLGYWPRKRTKRIYPNLTTYPQSEKTKLMGFGGYKAGSLHAIVFDNRKGSLTFGQEISVPITVLDCPPLKIIGVRAYTILPKGQQVLTQALIKELPKDSSLKIKTGNFKTEEKLMEIEKKLDKVSKFRLIVSTQPRLSGVGKKKPEIFEIEVGGKNIKENFEYIKTILGKEISAKDIIKEGELVDVIGVTKGKGTEGPVKRFGIKVQVRKATKKRRHVGSLGQERPGKVRHTVPMAGQFGLFTRTEFNKRVLKIGEKGDEVTPKSGFTGYGIVKNNYVLLEGSVPGSKKRLILFRPAVRPPRLKFYLPEVKEIIK